MTPDDPTPTADIPDAQPAADTATEHPPADEHPPAEAAAAPPESAPAEGAAPAAPPAETVPSKKKWYIIKVTSGREESIKAAIERRVKIEGLEEYFGQIYIPVERVTEIKKVKETKNGEKVTKERRVTKERKKFPGYIMAEVEFNDRILYLFRETSGVGDFVGAGGPGKPPPPMTDIEVKRMLGEAVPEEQKKGQKIKVKLDFEKGDKVRIREGAFSNMEGEVKEITEPKEAGETPKVTVEVQIFGRPVGVELDYWQVDKV
jgi:transcriptional antiterminator NusG